MLTTAQILSCDGQTPKLTWRGPYSVTAYVLAVVTEVVKNDCDRGLSQPQQQAHLPAFQQSTQAFCRPKLLHPQKLFIRLFNM